MEHQQGSPPKGSSANIVCNDKQVQWHRHAEPGANAGNSSRGPVHTTCCPARLSISPGTTFRSECLTWTCARAPAGGWPHDKRTAPLRGRSSSHSTRKPMISPPWNRPQHSGSRIHRKGPQRCQSLQRSSSASACLRPCTVDVNHAGSDDAQNGVLKRNPVKLGIRPKRPVRQFPSKRDCSHFPRVASH